MAAEVSKGVCVPAKAQDDLIVMLEAQVRRAGELAAGIGSLSREIARRCDAVEAGTDYAQDRLLSLSQGDAGSGAERRLRSIVDLMEERKDGFERELQGQELRIEERLRSEGRLALNVGRYSGKDPELAARAYRAGIDEWAREAPGPRKEELFLRIVRMGAYYGISRILGREEKRRVIDEAFDGMARGLLRDALGRVEEEELSRLARGARAKHPPPRFPKETP
jgi:hypothetical protein